MIESLFILFLGCVVVFGVVYGVLWSICKISARQKPVSKRRVLAIAAAISLVLIICVTIYLANGFSALPNQ